MSIKNISLHFQTFIFAINCNNSVRLLSDNSQSSTQISYPIIIQSVWNDMKKQNNLRQTKFRRTVATSPRCFKLQRYLKNYKCTFFKAFFHKCSFAGKLLESTWRCCQSSSGLILNSQVYSIIGSTLSILHFVLHCKTLGEIPFSLILKPCF